MPNQLFPLFKEAFGKDYPKGTPIRIIQTEYPVPKSDRNIIFSDIVLLVAEKDLYHMECQMTNDRDMTVRMIEYDFHTQTYSLEDIRAKHLTMFIPFKLLSFRPRMTSRKNPIQENELTQYVRSLIVILEEEFEYGNISSLEFKDYVKFINLAAERVFHSQQHYAKEVFEVTKSVLELPSDIYRKAEMAEKLQQELEETKEEFALQKEEFTLQRKELEQKIAQLEAQLKEQNK